MVLVASDAEEPGRVDERTERARKILPRLARGELRRVGVAQNLAEAELMQNILLEEGIPSILRRTGGFDVPDFLAAGPRDVMVPESGAESARELLGTDSELSPDPEPQDFRRFAIRVMAVLLIGLLLLGVITTLLAALF